MRVNNFIFHYAGMKWQLKRTGNGWFLYHCFLSKKVRVWDNKIDPELAQIAAEFWLYDNGKRKGWIDLHKNISSPHSARPKK